MTQFVKDALERAVKAFAQSLIAVGLAGATDIISVDWLNSLSIAALAFVISVLTSIVSYNVGDKGTASLVDLNSNGIPDDEEEA